MFTIKVRGINETIRNLEDIRNLINREIENVHILGITKFQSKAIENEKAVDTGTLRRSIHVAAPGISHAQDLDDASGGNPSNKNPIKKGQGQLLIHKNHKIKSYVGTWLGYAKKIHRDGGIKGKGKYFLRKAFKSEWKNVHTFIGREVKKLLVIGSQLARHI